MYYVSLSNMKYKYVNSKSKLHTKNITRENITKAMVSVWHS